MTRALILTLLFAMASLSHASNNFDKNKNKVNAEYKDEVCTLVLRKLRSSFEKLRTGNITDTKTSRVADLTNTYRLLKCNNEKLLIDVLACTNSKIIYHDDCRKIRLDK